MSWRTTHRPEHINHRKQKDSQVYVACFMCAPNANTDEGATPKTSANKTVPGSGRCAPFDPTWPPPTERPNHPTARFENRDRYTPCGLKTRRPDLGHQKKLEMNKCEDFKMPVCPRCKCEYREGFKVCADCGVELVDELPEENDLIKIPEDRRSAFPEVERAYKPKKPSGKGSREARLLMLRNGLPGALVAGILLHILQLLTVTILPIFAPVENHLIWRILKFFLILAGIFVISAIIGGFLGWLISQAALKGKTRNPTEIKRISLFCALLSCATALVAGGFTKVEMFGSFLGFIWGGATFLCFIPCTVFFATEVLEELFCENCEEYMKKIVSKKISLFKERILMNYLESRSFEYIASLLPPMDQDVKDYRGSNEEERYRWYCLGDFATRSERYIVLTFYYCGQCKDIGFLDATTTTKITSWDYKETDNRLISSTSLTDNEVSTLLDRTKS